MTKENTEKKRNMSMTGTEKTNNYKIIMNN